MKNKRGMFPAFVVLLPVLFFVNNTHAQGCCGIGGSLVSGGHPVLNKYTFLINPTGYYADARDPERHRGGIGTMLAYGMTDRLSLSLATSYVWATYADRIVIPELSVDSGVTYRNNGFGDGYLAAQFALIKLTPMNKQELVAGIDAGIPWGSHDKKVKGAVLPGNVQTGNGGFSVNGFLTYLKAFPTMHYAVTSTVAGRVNFQTLKKNDPSDELMVRDPGDEFSVMLTSLVGPFFETRGSVTFNYYLKGPTRDIHNVPVVESGRRISVMPALEYSISSNVQVLINADFPLWRKGTQINFSNDKLIHAGVYWFIGRPENPHQIRTISL
jgi:hypothetical protein